MSKRKYKIMIEVTLLFLCLFPLILVLVNSITSNALLTSTQINTIIDGVTISNGLTDNFRNSLSQYFEFDGAIGNACYAIMSNAVMVHIIYLFIEVACFIPKFAIKAMNTFSGGKD